MSILIKGMKMPTEGYRLILVCAGGTVQTTDGETTAVPVPPHGRLIDADALIAKCGGWYTEEGTDIGFIGSVKQLLDEEAPTIIPAEEGE